jgi:hypothetical protein
MPKSWEQVATLAKGEMVLNNPQANNIANFVNSAIGKPNTSTGFGDIIIKEMTVVTNEPKTFVRKLENLRMVTT